MTGAPLRVLFARPCIPPNTGTTIRTAAVTGCELHLAGPLGFELTDKHVKRAGLDYHDMARVAVHQDLSTALDALTQGPQSSAAQALPLGMSREPGRVFAFSSHATQFFTEIAYQPGDVLLFGPEPTGLLPEEMEDPRVTATLRIPMLPQRRSLNLSHCAALAIYEAWRQWGFPDAC